MQSLYISNTPLQIGDSVRVLISCVVILKLVGKNRAE